MKAELATLIAVALLPASICAQETLVGKYSGRVEYIRAQGGPQNIEFLLDSEENGVLTGRMRSYERRCAGEYQLVGMRVNERVQLKSTNVGRLADCVVNFDLTVNGNQLTGTATGLPAQFSKK
jgi:hypothetical protein